MAACANHTLYFFRAEIVSYTDIFESSFVWLNALWQLSKASMLQLQRPEEFESSVWFLTSSHPSIHSTLMTNTSALLNNSLIADRYIVHSICKITLTAQCTNKNSNNNLCKLCPILSKNVDR